MNWLLAVLVSPAALASVMVSRVRILWLSCRTPNVRGDNLILSVTLPLAGTLNDVFASVIRF